MMGDRVEESHELSGTFGNANGTLLTDAERLEAGQDGTIGSTTTPPATDRSTAFLDGLRGLAALCVFIQHYMGSFAFNLHEHGFGENGNYFTVSLPFIRVFYNGGSAAVSIFFVLSGYVLSKSVVRMVRNCQRQNCGTALLSAVVRRPFRLYLPCAGFTLIVAVLMHVPFPIVPGKEWCPQKENVFAQIGHWFTETTKFFNPFQKHGSDQYWYPYDLVLWTIPLELKGSMLIYAVTAAYAFSGLTPKWAISLLSVSVVLLLQLGQWSPACFISGIILSIVDIYALDLTYLAHYFTLRKQVLITHGIFIVAWYLLSQPAVAGKPEWSLDTPGWHTLSQLTPSYYNAGQYYRFWQSYGAILLVYTTLRLSWLQAFLNTRFMRYLGKMSFMFYLIHLPYLYTFGDQFGRVFGHTPFGSEARWWDNIVWIPDIGAVGLNPRFFVLIIVQVSIILTLSDVATRLLDNPSVRIGKRIAQKLGLESPAGARKEGPVEHGRGPDPAIPMTSVS